VCVRAMIHVHMHAHAYTHKETEKKLVLIGHLDFLGIVSNA